MAMELEARITSESDIEPPVPEEGAPIFQMSKPIASSDSRAYRRSELSMGTLDKLAVSEFRGYVHQRAGSA